MPARRAGSRHPPWRRFFGSPWIHFAHFCIAHCSTTVENCILLNKPVITPRRGLSRDIADYYLRLNVTKAWLSVRDNPALTVDELARERYKRDRITVVQLVAVDNVVRHLITRSTGSEDRRGQHPE
jgi:hypothetical protein